MHLQFQVVFDQNVGYFTSFILISMALALLHPALALMLLAMLTSLLNGYLT
jgi:hypothetical protein